MAKVDVKGLAQAARDRMTRAGSPDATAAVAETPPLVSAEKSPFAPQPVPGPAPKIGVLAGLAATARSRLDAASGRLRRRARPSAARDTGPVSSTRAGDRRRALMRTTALVALSAAVIVTAGQFMQNRAAERQAAKPASAPRDIVALSAATLPDLPATARVLPPLPVMTDPAALAEVTVSHPAPDAAEDAVRLAAAGDGAAAPLPLLPAPEAPLPRPPTSTLPVPGPTAPPPTISDAPTTTLPALAAAADACGAVLSVTAAGQGLMLIRLEAPCEAGRFAILRHGPLSVSARLDDDGALDLALPALDPAGEVTLRLPDGTEHMAATAVDLTGLRRAVLQWQADDGLELHAFEGGAVDYGGPGHISADYPGLSPETGLPAKGGWLMRLGDDRAPVPQYADIYTYPADATVPVRLTIEALVTAETCDSELLGVAALTGAGAGPRVDEITLAMPGCDAQGDYVVLNYPAEGAKLVAASD